MFDFSSICPYTDQDVKPTLKKLVNNPELIETLIHFRFPSAPQWQKTILGLVLRTFLRFKLRNITTVYQFQCVVESYMAHMIKTTTKGLSSSGLDQLDLTKPHLFISNHRDIALDPAFVNYILHVNGQDTVQIAIGDNLLSKPWVSDVMRLNRSFIVKRSAKTKREKLQNSKELSAYIHDALHQQGNHIWIAQREGRAKDGIDKTNSALISMLGLNKAKPQEFADYIRELRIVPVSIAYEYDPCDIYKAEELLQQSQHGDYQKEEHEDIRSISRGIVGEKGRVHLHFSPVLSGDYANAKEVAEEIDNAIVSTYRLMPTNWVALGEPCTDLSQRDELEAKSYFDARSNSISAEAKEVLLNMYANPIRNKRQIVEK